VCGGGGGGMAASLVFEELRLRIAAARCGLQRFSRFPSGVPEPGEVRGPKVNIPGFMSRHCGR